jgi:hypothetical protein
VGEDLLGTNGKGRNQYYRRVLVRNLMWSRMLRGRLPRLSFQTSLTGGLFLCK